MEERLNADRFIITQYSSWLFIIINLSFVVILIVYHVESHELDMHN